MENGPEPKLYQMGSKNLSQVASALAATHSGVHKHRLGIESGPAYRLQHKYRGPRPGDRRMRFNAGNA
jgi:hypothetical protein